ncbi:hypothetical protein [uncultured Parabacteroides sp.]|uniref:hypothetical protein n=1 Tax=uncultured Parabacteroides sp. TaxID=512312 RepID=UPI0026397A27|nr:hypothetical protein [uncultured Parabacteroides sp.]
MKNRYFRGLIVALTFILPIICYAQRENKILRHELQITLGLNSYFAFEFDPSYSYMFHKNVGIVLGMRFVKEVVDNLHYDLVSNTNYQWHVNERKEVSNLLFRSAIRFQFFILDGILFVTEPGVLLNIIPNEKLEFSYVNVKNFEPIPSKYKIVKNRNGSILFYNCKSYISVNIDNIALLFGYNISTFDIYSGRRNIIIESDAFNKHLPCKKRLLHTGFIGVSYFF